ncbi:hypothetical protein N7488_010150 [Penicillium malachiteum]|nr:hypothetical protein N7488_010150 [Penicillium malachiteum]
MHFSTIIAILFATLAIAAPADATSNNDASTNAAETDHRRCRPRYDECIELKSDSNATENTEVNTVEIGATRTTAGVIEPIKPQAQFSTTCKPVIKSWPKSGGFKFEVQNTCTSVDESIWKLHEETKLLVGSSSRFKHS